MSDDFFDDIQDDEAGRGGVERDRWGRAMLIPAGGGDKVPYSSASGLADYISDDRYLHTWQMRYLAIAMGRNPDLARLAASEPYHTGLTPLSARDKRESAYRVDQLIERALDRQLIHEKADYGTAFHQHTEPGAPPPPDEDEQMKLDVASFEAFIRSEAIEIVDTELFVANDSLMTAGTFDHGCRFLGHPGLDGYVITDKKTGRVDPWHWAIQMAVYGGAEAYDKETGERRPIAPDVNQEFGVVFHTSKGKTKAHIVDIAWGAEAARVAADVRELRKVKPGVTYASPSFEQRLAACTTKDEALRLYYSITDDDQRDQVVTLGKALA